MCSPGWGNLVAIDWNDLPAGREFDGKFLKNVKSSSTLKNAGGKERRPELRRSARRQQFIITVSSWRFYNRQEEVLDQKSPKVNWKVIDRFVFNYLAVDNAGQTADNKHTGSMIFRFFLLASKTDKPLGDNTFQNQLVNLICWQAFSFIRFFNCFFLFSFEAEIDAF